MTTRDYFTEFTQAEATALSQQHIDRSARIASINPLASMFESAGMDAIAALVMTTGVAIGATADVTEYPVESGSDVSDHKRDKPDVIRLSGAVTTPNRVDAPRLVTDALKELKRSREDNTRLLTVELPLTTYENCTVIGFNTSQDVRNARGLLFTVTLEQIEVRDVQSSVSVEVLEQAGVTTDALALISGQDVLVADLLPTSTIEAEEQQSAIAAVQAAVDARNRGETGQAGTELLTNQAFAGAFETSPFASGDFQSRDVSDLQMEFIRAQLNAIRNAGVDATDIQLQEELDALANSLRFGELSPFEQVRVDVGVDPRDAFVVPLTRIDAQTVGVTTALPVAVDGVRTNHFKATIELKYKQTESTTPGLFGGLHFHWEISAGFLRIGTFTRRAIPDWSFQGVRVTSGQWSREMYNRDGEGGVLVVLDNRSEPSDRMDRDAFTGASPTHTLLYMDDRWQAYRLFGAN